MADPDRPDRAEVACRFEPSAESVVVETGVAEAGQGLHPMLVRLAARTLGIDEERVTVEHVTGAGAPRDPGMFGSRGANVTGSALVRAAAQLRAAILAQALAKSGGATAEIDRDWRFVRCGQTEIKLSELNPERVIAGYETADPAIAYGAQHATVHCDRRTGEVHVEQVSAVHDLGMVLDEDGARAQVEGGIAQGIGAALSELVTFAADGSVLQTGFVNHLVPTAVGQARTDIRFLAGRDDPPQRTGAKGIGEAAIMGVPAAIANAVGAVAAARVTQLPLTPERVLRTLDASAAAKPAGGQR
jgi:CO/xanthine dehydrogenase Mo-binding subunit